MIQTDSMPRDDFIWYTDQMILTSCVFCGNKFGNINFKGKCVCEDCLSYIKELM